VGGEGTRKKGPRKSEGHMFQLLQYLGGSIQLQAGKRENVIQHTLGKENNSKNGGGGGFAERGRGVQSAIEEKWTDFRSNFSPVYSEANVNPGGREKGPAGFCAQKTQVITKGEDQRPILR